MRNRMEILRDGVWYALRLKDRQAIKYNAVINRVGEVRNREISHSNTFSIPNITENQKALGLNVFNQRDLARALNSKYEAKYYIGDKLVKEGFIVINNSERDIKLNFLDGALGIVDTWKSTTFKQLLQDPSLNRPLDYQTALDEMQAYDMTVAPWSPLSQVGVRGHELALFPNTLNQIGDQFQIGSAETREDDVFIPSQSRPVFNTKAVFDLATETYGYTPIYDPSVNWGDVEKRYFSGDKANEGAEPEDVQQTIVHPVIASSEPYVFMWYKPFGISSQITFWRSKVMYEMPPTSSLPGTFFQGKTVNGINFSQTHWYGVDPPPGPIWAGPVQENSSEFFNKNIIYVPDLSGGNSGFITFNFEWSNNPFGNQIQREARYYGFWNTVTPGTIVGKQLFADGSSLPGAPMIDKAFLNTPPAGATDFIGITVQMVQTHYGWWINNEGVDLPILNMQVTEEAVPQGEITFGEYNDYAVAVTDLTHAATDKSVKDVLSGIMHQAGILMNIDAQAKTVKFFGYGHYQTQKENGVFYDWSEYFQKDSLIKRNTDYGQKYGKINRIGLGKPYQGNTYDRQLSNHLEDSKYQALAKDELKDFGDISSVKSIGNTNYPYFEYGVDGMSMVEKTGDIDGLTQKTPYGVVQGIINDLAHISNVNYINIPYGVSEWYSLVDKALRVVGRFNLPISVIKTLDISRPVYIANLGGFYIIEEIAQYENSKKAVDIKLIKLIDNLRES